MKWKLLPPSQLEKLVAAGKPIYVLNTSSLADGAKGMIVVNFHEGNRRDYFKMPPTFIPMAISDAIPAKKLIDSRDFKQSLVRGMLTLVDPDQAEDYLATTEAQDEYEALVLSEHSMKSKGLDLETEVVKRTKIAHQTSEGGQGPMQDISATDTVSNKVRGLIESLTSGSITAKDVLVELRRHQTALTTVDLSYAMANTSDPDLLTWLKKSNVEASKKVAADAEPIKRGRKPASSKKDESAFDFDDKAPLSAEDLAADARAKSQAMSQQAVRGESKIASEIDALMSGKVF